MRRPSRQSAEAEGYFAPMADMMAGLLFIFLVLLMVFALNNYADPAVNQDQSDRAEQERQRLISEILASRTALLENITNDLREKNIDAKAEAASGRIRMPSQQFFPIGEARASVDGGRRFADLGEVLWRRTACYVESGTPCLEKARARVESALLSVKVRPGDVGVAPMAPETLAATRMFQAFGTIMSAQPTIFEMRNEKGGNVFVASGDVQGSFDNSRTLGDVVITISMSLPPPRTLCVGAPGCR